ncbi:MAG: hypothetical protein ABR586_10605 [Thermoplasmatota archaeon]
MPASAPAATPAATAAPSSTSCRPSWATTAPGSIIAHLSTQLCDVWEASSPGTARERAAHVEEQVQLALEDLAEQDMHGYLALTEEQRSLYAPDLEQLVQEAFDRTSFSHLLRKPFVSWEGTLVQSVRPPHLILVVSVSL